MLAAVSGGADSVALAWLLHELAARDALVLAAIGHVHHQLRGAEADADEAFCGALAARMGVPFFSGRVDVLPEVDAGGGSIESVARRLRYAWLEDAASRAGAAYIATGHTLEDQAETVLLRLLRGAGGRGISGIRPVRGAVIRPLIDCRRADVRAYLASIGESFREDASNGDHAIARNRVRHELLPVIERIAPGGVEALARAATLAADDEKYLSLAAIDAARSVVLLNTDGVRLDAGRLSDLDPALARRVVRAAIEEAAPDLGGRIAAAHIEAVRALAAAGETGHLDLAGISVELDDGAIRFTRAPDEGRRAAAGAPVFGYALACPGRAVVPEAGFVISAACDQLAARGVETKEGRHAFQVVVAAGAIRWPLTIRNRRPGDRIKPLGAPGRKKVQDLLVDMKMPRADRDRVAVVVDADGQLVWVVGVTPADECRARTPEAEMVVLRAERR